MRRAPGHERRALLDAETVLLVDDCNGRVAELEAFLDERVCAHHDVGAENSLALALARGAREERAAHSELEAEVRNGQKMLLSEGFGRRHERALAAALDRAQERVERDHRLARADVALQEALHRGGAREVAVDLPDRLLLVRRERERQRLAVAVDELARLAECRRERALALGDTARDPDLEDEQLLEREPLARRLSLVEVARPVYGGERVALQGQPLALAQLGGKRIGDVHRERKCGVDDAPHRRGGDLLGSRIHGSEVSGRAGLIADVVGAGLEAPAAELAAQPDRRAGLETIGEPWLVEPGDADRRGAVVDSRDDPRAPPSAHRALLDVEDASRDDDLLALAERCDRHLVRGRLVAARPVLEHVAHGREPELAELPLRHCGNAWQRVEPELEAVRPKRARGRRPGPGLVQACKDRLSTGACHRPRHRAHRSISRGPDVRPSVVGVRLAGRRPQPSRLSRRRGQARRRRTRSRARRTSSHLTAR